VVRQKAGLALPAGLGWLAGWTGRFAAPGAVVASLLTLLEAYCLEQFSGPTPPLPPGVSQSAEGAFLDPIFFHYPLMASTLALLACSLRLAMRHGPFANSGIFGAAGAWVLGVIFVASSPARWTLVAVGAFMGFYQAMDVRGLPLRVAVACAIVGALGAVSARDAQQVVAMPALVLVLAVSLGVLRASRRFGHRVVLWINGGVSQVTPAPREP